MRLLLDGHMPLAVAKQLRAEGHDVEALPEWQGGVYREKRDDEILRAARVEERVFITYDRRTIPNTLTHWAETGEHHAGLVFVDDKTVRSSDVGGLLRSLRRLIDETGDESWQDRVEFLKRA